MANFGPSKTWTDGEILSHTDLNAALLDIINNVTNNNIDADNIDETDDYTWSGANSFSGGHSIKVLSNAASSIVTGTTLEWDPGDGGQMTDNSSGISLDFKLPDASDNQDVFASIAAICLDDTSTSEDGELSFRVATAGTNTEQMTLSNSALTVTPAITASGGITGSVTSSNATITGGSITGITDIAIADGGTGASTAAAARTNLGLEIGVDVQAYDAELQALSGLTPTDSNIIVGNGSTFVTESGATARTSLGLGSIATQSASAVSITGGSLTGMTSYSGGTISGTTGTFSGATTVGSAGATADFAVWTDGTSSTAAGFTVDASADEVIVGQLSGGGNTTFKVRNRLNNTVFSVTPDAPSTTVFAPNIATGSAGTLTVKTGSINSDSIRLEAGGTTSTWLESRGYLGHSWYVDSTRSMTLDSTGLGVGVDSPSHELAVVSTSSGPVVEVESTAVNGNPSFRLKNDAQEWQWQLRGAESDSLVAWDVTGAAGRLYLTTDGKLCINRTSGNTALNIDPHTTGSPNIQLYNKTNDAYTYLKNDGSAFVIQNSYGTTAGFKPIQFMANGSINLHIDEVGGSVGIGTSSPSNLLTLQKNQGADTALEIYNTNSGASAKASLKVGYNSSNHLHIYRAGNAAGIVYNATQSGSSHQFQIAGSAQATLDATGLGIGTSSPEAPLEVIADSLQGYAMFLEAAASGTEGAALRGKGTYSIADGGTQTFTVANGAIVMISENSTGDGAMFFCGYKSATVTLVADPNSRYANTVTAGKISLTKSASSGTVTLTNNSLGTRSFTILKIMCSD